MNLNDDAFSDKMGDIVFAAIQHANSLPTPQEASDALVGAAAHMVKAAAARTSTNEALLMFTHSFRMVMS